MFHVSACADVIHVDTVEMTPQEKHVGQRGQREMHKEGRGLMERSGEKAAAHGGRKEQGGRGEEEEVGMGGAGGRRGQGYAGASACGDGIDGHISHSSVSRRDHRT